MTLEELLNKLIEKGWKPWWKEKFKLEVRQSSIELITDYWKFYSLNDLCSIESWFWQFVCENELYKYNKKTCIQAQVKQFWYDDDDWLLFQDDAEYRLMLSSIQDKKEDFILSNVKI